ncbi:MAG: PolC-type DNA polymerase III [Candidatus Competibacterales bacterium]
MSLTFPPLARQAITSPPVVIIDFETTGGSPQQGGRVTEVGAVRIEEGCLTERFESLLCTHTPIPPAIQSLTGITDAMVAAAPPAAEVMEALWHWLGPTPLVAHNAAFDAAFLDAQWRRLPRRRQQPFVCTLRLARRLMPEAKRHGLAHLARVTPLPDGGGRHRALADATTTAHLWLHLLQLLQERHGVATPPWDGLQRLQTTPRRALPRALEELRAGAPTSICHRS